jgi:hypothetical protein
MLRQEAASNDHARKPRVRVVCGRAGAPQPA